MKLRTSYFRILFIVLLMLLPKVARGGDTSYYARVKASVIPSDETIAAGKVYVTDDQSKEPIDEEYLISITSDHSTQENSEPTYYFYCFAKVSNVEYYFDGWFDNQACTGKPINDGLTFTYPVIGSTTEPNLKNIYAHFVEKTYDIFYFDSDGKTPLDELTPVKYKKATGFELPEPTKEHYYFVKWVVFDTNNGGWNDGDEYSKNETMIVDKNTRNGDVYFKAVWTPVPYEISYKTNGGLPESIPVQTYTYDDTSINLPQKPTKDESIFKGWTVTSTVSKENDWGPSIDPGTTIIKGPKIYGNVTLTAKWETKTYTAKFYDGNEELLNLKYNKAEGLTMPEYSKEHYIFQYWEIVEAPGQGWTEEHYTANTKIVDKNGNVTFKAVWTPVPYEISYNTNGGLPESIPVQTYTYDDTSINLPQKPTKEESTFSGWEVASTDGSQNDWLPSGYILTSSIKGPKFGNVTLTAQWNVITYKVEFRDDDGKTLLENLLPNSYSKDGGFNFPSYSKPGYSVDYWEVIGNPGGGWTNDEAEQNYKPGNTINGKNADVSFKAHYKLETYTITFKHNDVNGTESSMTYDYENDFTLTVPEKSGCVFKGWKPEAASGWWEVSEPYKGTITARTAYGDVTLIAQWLGGLIVELEGGEDVSEDCYAVFKVSGEGVEYLISVSKNHPEVLGSLENGKKYTIESMEWHKAYELDPVKQQEVYKVDDKQTVTFTATKTTPTKVSDSHRDF